MRAFITVELPQGLQADVHALQQRLAAALPQDPQSARLARALRWTPAANIHLTLRFLGATSAAQHAAIVAHLHARAAMYAPFFLSLGGAGCFPNYRRPSVLWLGVQDAGSAGTLAALQQSVEESAVAAGFTPEARAYTPHITLARIGRSATANDVAQIGTLMQRSVQLPAVRLWQRTLPVDHIAFMESNLQPQGAIYTTHERIPLPAPNSRAQRLG
jgi:2'-5' RNA ligase